MKETIEFSDLETWSNHYKTDLVNLPFKSKTAAISLDELEGFIKDAKAKHSPEFKALKVYFVRYKFKPGAKQDRIEKAKDGTDLSQISLVFVPAKIIDRPNWIVEELKDKGDNTKILSLCVCNPDSDPAKDETGMCPPKGTCP